MISKNTHVKTFIQINYLFFLFFRSYFECFQKSGFYPKILSFVEMYLLKIRSEVKNPRISASGVSFAIKLGLLIKIWAGDYILYIWLKISP